MKHEIRYMELMYRKEMVNNMIKKVEEESHSVITKLFKSMDEDIEDKYAGSLVILNRWMKDIEKDMELLELEENIMNSIFEQSTKEENEPKITMKNAKKETIEAIKSAINDGKISKDKGEWCIDVITDIKD